MTPPQTLGRTNGEGAETDALDPAARDKLIQSFSACALGKRDARQRPPRNTSLITFVI